MTHLAKAGQHRDQHGKSIPDLSMARDLCGLIMGVHMGRCCRASTKLVNWLAPVWMAGCPVPSPSCKLDSA